jgi:hypothetical protein
LAKIRQDAKERQEGEREALRRQYEEKSTTDKGFWLNKKQIELEKIQVAEKARIDIEKSVTQQGGG